MKTNVLLCALLAALPVVGGPLIDLESYDAGQIVPVDFVGPLWVTPKPVETGGVKVEKVKTPSGWALDVTVTDDALTNPGILLRPPKGQLYWDLSQFEHLSADIENLDKDQQTMVSVRVTNPLVGKDYQIANNSGFGLNPGEKRTLKLYYPQADEFAKCRIDGLRATPPGIPGKKNIDGRRVDAIIFWGHNVKNYSRNGSARYRISNIRLEKPYAGPGAPVDDPARFYPFVDRYGQYVHQDWPDKIHSDADFAVRLEKEKAKRNPRIANWDKWGGWNDGPALKATGFFYPTKFEGKWYLVDPDGKLFFSHGINAVRGSAKGAQRDPKWYETGDPGQKKTFDFRLDNIGRKYGEKYPDIYPGVVAARLESWGINTIGNWSDPAIQKVRKTPYTMEFRLPRAKNGIVRTEDFRGFHDVFSPEFEEALRKSTADGVAAGAKDDPWCIGFFIGNEIPWGDRTALARSTFRSPPETAAKREFVRDLQTKYLTAAALNRKWGTHYRDWNEVLNSTEPPDPEKSCEDMLAFNAKFLDRFYLLCRRTVKEFSPNHLYLGSRLHISGHPEAYAAAAKYCDVVSRNVYSWSLDGFRQEGLPPDKPVMITEFHIAVLDRGMFNADMRPAGITQDDRAHAYLRIVQGALLHPQIVGAHYFCWADQCLTGRFDGENLAIGVVDVADTPYWELTAMMRKVGENMMRYRREGKFECDWEK